MKKPIGITFEVGKSDRGWFAYLGKLKLLQVRPSHHQRNGSWVPAKHGGFKFDIVIGKLRRPIPRLYKWAFWADKNYVSHESAFNPWNSGNYWFVYTFPIEIGLFFSLCYGAGERQPGFYVGTKTYEVNQISQDRKIYKPDRNDVFLPRIAWGKASEKGNIYLCPSASIRDDMVE